MIHLDISLEAPAWQDTGLEPLARRAFDATLGHLGIEGEVEISLLGCDDARIATLNAEFRGKPAPTNVLSWPAEDLAPDAPGATPSRPEPDPHFPDEPLALGDIAIAHETCAREAAEQGKPMPDHVTHLLVHGLLHLLGYDHVRDADATLMEATEVEILGKLGLPDPY